MGYGPMTGGRRGFCAGAAPSPGRGGGRGWRNQFHATGLTGWQRAAQADAQAAEPIGSSPEPFARLDEKLTEVFERLERLESAKQD
jgi:hypothetical protein